MSHVHVIATGGTISSHHDGTRWTNLDGAALLDELGPLDATVTVEDVATGPSSSLTVTDMQRVVDRVAAAVAAGAEGVVVTHGSDTVELTAFVAELCAGVLARTVPVVFTGSMRPHSHPAADGLHNLRDAVAVAAAPQARGSEVLVCFDGTLHAASVVQKANAMVVDAFTSAPFEPLGRMSSGEVPVLPVAPARPQATALAPHVPLLTVHPGMTPEEVDRCRADAPAIVVEVFGDLNVPRPLWEPIHRAWGEGVLVILASRSFTDTFADEGLAQLGAVGAGGLTAQKARLAAMAAVGSTADRAAAIEFLGHYALHFAPGDERRTS